MTRNRTGAKNSASSSSKNAPRAVSSLPDNTSHAESSPAEASSAVFLGGATALRYWFGDRNAVRACRPLEVVPGYFEARPTKGGIPWTRLERLGISGNIHLDVPELSRRCRIAGVSAHVLAAPPPFTFVKLAKDVYIESPVAAIVRSSSLLSRGERMLLINQALGCYAVQLGTLIRRSPLATIEDFERFVRASAGLRGVEQVRLLLRYAVACTASPAEARVAALLTLPTCWGGYGLPRPEANARIEVRRADGTVAPRYADLLWRARRLVLEYDSDAFHVGAEKIGMDSTRRAELQKEGYTVVTLTNLQLRERGGIENVVRALCKALGRPASFENVAGFSEKTSLLGEQLRHVRALVR